MKLLLTEKGTEIIENSAEPDFFVENDTFVKIMQDKDFALKILNETERVELIIGSLGIMQNDIYVDETGILHPELDIKVTKNNSFGYFQKIK